MPTEHFKSKEAYRKSRAYTHIHGIPTRATDVVVAGKRHKVEHRKVSDPRLGKGKQRKARRKRPAAHKRG